MKLVDKLVEKIRSIGGRGLFNSVKTVIKGGANTCGCCGKHFLTEEAYAKHKCPKNNWLKPTDPAFATRRR